MLSNEIMAKVENLAGQVAEREGCEVYDIEFSGHSGRRTLRIFIDKVGGVGIEDCSNVSRGLSLLLDVEDPIEGAYDLEVSTPGLDRVLKKPWHFERAIGKKIQFRLARPLGEMGLQNKKMSAAKQVAETLVAADQTGIQIQIETETIQIPYAEIEKAKMQFDFASTKQPKKGKKN